MKGMMNHPRSKPRFLNAEVAEAYVYKAQTRRTESRMNPQEYDRMAIVLSGAANARWEEDGQARSMRAGPGEVVHAPPTLLWTEFNDPSPRLTSICLSFRWRHPLPLPHKVHDRLGLIHALADAILSIQGSA